MAKLKLLAPASNAPGESVELETNVEEDDTALAWAADDEHKFLNTGRTWVYVKKGAGAAVMTITTHKLVGGLQLPDRTRNIDANSEKFYGPYPFDLHSEIGGDDDKYATVAFSEVVDLEVAFVRL